MERTVALKAFNEQTQARFILSVNRSYAPQAVQRECAKFLKDKNGLPIPVEVILDFFSKSVPDHCRLKVEIQGNSHGAFLEVMWLDKETSAQVLRDVRSFSTTMGISDHGNIKVGKDSRGQGYGADYAFDMFRFMHIIQVNENRITASSVNGGHFWSLMGVKYKEEDDTEDSDWRDNNKIVDQLGARLDILTAYIPEDIKEDLERILKNFKRSRNPEYIWSLSDYKYDLRERGLTNEILSVIGDGYQMNAEAIAYLKRQKELPLGQLLMVSTTWLGIFNPKDKQTIKRLERYVGRSFATGDALEIKKSASPRRRKKNTTKPGAP
jgi:hypothetical protein